MRKRNRWAVLVLLLALLSSVGYAQAEGAWPPDDAETYIQALEEAMDAHYGERDAWPQGFDAYLSIAKYYSGLDESYEPLTAWASESLQALERAAVSNKNDERAAADFLYALQHEMESSEGFSRSWPYQAHALIGAAFVYSGNADLSGNVALPSEADITQEQAIAIACEAIQEKYDLSDEDIDQLGVFTHFSVGDGIYFQSPYWGVVIGINEFGYERYYAYILSPTGEIMTAMRNDGNG